jgi:hypothetical protein
MKDYIDEVISSDGKDRLYNCECKIVASGSNYVLECVDWVGFRLSGHQIRKLWYGRPSKFDPRFSFKPSGKVTMSMLSWSKSRVDKYMQALDAPALFEDNDKI